MKSAGLHGVPTETFSACGHGEWLRQGQLRRIVTVGHWERLRTKRCNTGIYHRRMASFATWFTTREGRSTVGRALAVLGVVALLGDAPLWQVASWLAVPAIAGLLTALGAVLNPTKRP